MNITRTQLLKNYDDSGWFWIDPVNGLLEQHTNNLTMVGVAYDQPWHLEQYKPDRLYAYDP